MYEERQEIHGQRRREREIEREQSPERETDKSKAVLNIETKREWPWQARNKGRYSAGGGLSYAFCAEPSNTRPYRVNPLRPL